MELLKQLYEIHSPSGSEKKMKKFVKNYIREVCPDATISHDNAGNVYVTKGESDTYPCIVAHLDQVQKTHSKDFTVMQCGDRIFGYSPSRGCTEGLGADDKNGIWIALKCIQRFDVMKLAFFVGEEVGCVGSSKCDISFFKDCRFIIEPDRKGGHDFIQSMSMTKVCSDEFRDATNYKDYGYSLAEGLLTDVLCLVEDGVGISCINLSCGYYKPHTDEESTSWDELVNCLALVWNIINTCTKVYPHKYDYRSSGYQWYGGSAWSGKKWVWDGKSSYMKDDDWDYLRKKYGGSDDDLPFDDVDEGEPQIKVLKLNDYPNEWAWIDDMIAENPFYEPYELWPYMQADLTSAGWTSDDFYEYISEYYY